MNYAEAISYSQLTGIPLPLLFQTGTGDLAAIARLEAYQERQGAHLQELLTRQGLPTYVYQRAQQGLDALSSGTAPINIGGISYTTGAVDPTVVGPPTPTDVSPPGSPGTMSTGILIAAAIALFALGGRRGR